MLGINPAEWVAGLPPETGVFLLSMLPITELRASIPIGLEVFNLPIGSVFFLAVIGNIIPTIFILLLMPKLHDWLIKQRFIGDFLKKKLEQAEKKFSGNHAKYGAIALVLFVGIPLPFTGAWTGSLAAFIFNIPFKKSLPLIVIGVCIAATLVTLITIGAGGTLRLLF
jgi:uncharacterized membrane protein